MATLLDKAKTKLVIREYFYAVILLGLKTVLVTNKAPGFRGVDVATLATDGKTLIINTDFFNKLPLSRAVAALKHEALHVALLHNFRLSGRNPAKWNHACDYAINAILVQEGDDVGSEWLYDSAYANMSSEQIYTLLPAHEEDEGGGGTPGGENGEGSGRGRGTPGKGDADGGGNPGKEADIGNDVMPAPDMSEAAVAQAKANIMKAVSASKAMGKCPGWAETMLDSILRPTIDWREALRRFLNDVNKSDYSFSTPNRRMITQGYYLPSMYSVGNMRDSVIVLDTSGSMHDKRAQLFGEVCGIVEECLPSRVTVVYCDADVNHVDTFDETPTVDDVAVSAKSVGGGGTDLTVALDWIDENRSDTACCIVITDGYTPFGDERGYPVVWAIDTDVVPPWGETLKVGKNECH